MTVSSQPMIFEAECTILSSFFLCWVVEFLNHTVIENLGFSIKAAPKKTLFFFFFFGAGAEEKSLKVKLSSYFKKKIVVSK